LTTRIFIDVVRVWTSLVGNRRSSLSTNFAHVWHSQTALLALHRSSLDMLSSYRGPPPDAAVMCAATPTFSALSGAT
jgi:hypothetical protein